MSKTVNTSQAYIQAPLTREYVENFYEFVTADMWTSVVADTGSSIALRVGGGVNLVTDATDDDEVSLSTTSLIYPGTTNVKPGEITGRFASDIASGGDGTILTGSFLIGLGSSFAADIMGATTTHAVPTAGYYVALCLVAGETQLRLICITNGTATVNKQLDFAPTLASFFSYRFVMDVVPTSTPQVFVTVEIDSAGGQNFRSVREYGSSERDPFYRTPDVYACFPAAGLKNGLYCKNQGTNTGGREMRWDYAAWAIRRT